MRPASCAGFGHPRISPAPLLGCGFTVLDKPCPLQWLWLHYPGISSTPQWVSTSGSPVGCRGPTSLRQNLVLGCTLLVDDSKGGWVPRLLGSLGGKKAQGWNPHAWVV